MKKIIGLLFIILGVILEFMWLGVCFGTVIIGILLLIFAPRILFFPFNFFLILGLTMIRGQTYQSSGQFRYQWQDYTNNNYSNTQSTYSDIDKYYKVLNSTPYDTMDTIKKNYRELIKEYHYDSIASKDLPEDMVEFAEEKTKELNEAYAAIKKSRK